MRRTFSRRLALSADRYSFLPYNGTAIHPVNHEGQARAEIKDRLDRLACQRTRARAGRTAIAAPWPAASAAASRGSAQLPAGGDQRSAVRAGRFAQQRRPGAGAAGAPAGRLTGAGGAAAGAADWRLLA